MKNKGFSLVELIIVIAIMAILAAAIAPALIRYIDKSRRGDDVQAAATINTAVQSALANEDAYEEIATKMGGSVLITANAHPAGTATATFGAAQGITNIPSFLADVNSNLGNEAPKIKYTKNFTNGYNGSYAWNVSTNPAGKPVVVLRTNTNYELQPDIDACYK